MYILVELMNQRTGVSSVLADNAKLFSKMVVLNFFPIRHIESFPWPTVLPVLVLSIFLSLVILAIHCGFYFPLSDYLLPVQWSIFSYIR